MRINGKQKSAKRKRQDLKYSEWQEPSSKLKAKS